MKYGFYVFNNLKGYYNLAIFDSEEKAVESYRLLDALWSDEEFCEGFEDIDFEIHYDFAFNQLIGYEENIYKNLENDDDVIENFEYLINEDGFVHAVEDDIKLISEISVSIPC